MRLGRWAVQATERDLGSSFLVKWESGEGWMGFILSSWATSCKGREAISEGSHCGRSSGVVTRESVKEDGCGTQEGGRGFRTT